MPLLYANVKLRYGKLAEFNETVTELLPLVERQGWKLVVSWSTVVGDINEVHDIWEIPDANTIPESLAGLAAEAGFPELMEALCGQIEREVFRLIAKTPFSP
ncbi:MAG: NIPSNAP family protein [Solirubrobacterales bacterium]